MSNLVNKLLVGKKIRIYKFDKTLFMPDVELRNKILQEVSTLPEEALIKLDDFINDFHRNEKAQPNPIMQLSGIWSDLSEENLDLLTTQLTNRRSNNRRANHD